jgi:hypothetical protein
MWVQIDYGAQVNKIDKKNGYVNNVTVTGGFPPYTYQWFDANGAQVGSTNSASNLTAGNYTLNVADSRCGSIDVKYTIQNTMHDVAAPSLTDI